MNEPLMYCAGMRVPAVMVDVTRETSSMRGVGGSRQDIMTARDCGWDHDRAGKQPGSSGYRAHGPTACLKIPKCCCQ